MWGKTDTWTQTHKADTKIKAKTESPRPSTNSFGATTA